MKVTIITADKAVYVDNVFINGLNLDFIPTNIHALQWDTDSGWVEYNDGTANEYIIVLPDWAELALTERDAQINNTTTEILEASAQENKERATGLLLETDWVEFPSVTDVANTPHLLNKEVFDTYRLALRQFVINPLAGDITFPAKPAAEWSNV
jgi:hypothetical protein